MKNRRGVFITLEGPEKSGKSTQSRLLCHALKKKGIPFLFVREPGSTKIGERIRHMLLDKKNTRMTQETEMLLYMAARAQIVAETIRPALDRGMVVIADRFQDSTSAYQGYGLGLDLELIETLGQWVTKGIRPDLTLLLDFPASRDHLKKTRSQDRIEMRPSAFHERVRRGYRALARRHPDRIKVVCVDPDARLTQTRVWENVQICLSGVSSAKRGRFNV